MTDVIERDRLDGQLGLIDEAIDALIGTLSMYVHTLDIPSIKAGNFARGEIAVIRSNLEALTQQREPTAEMIEAGLHAYTSSGTHPVENVKAIYLAMERVRMKGEG